VEIDLLSVYGHLDSRERVVKPKREGGLSYLLEKDFTHKEILWLKEVEEGYVKANGNWW
jgi:hypothetical protein